MYRYFCWLNRVKRKVKGKSEYEFVEEDYLFLMNKFAKRLSAIKDVYQQHEESLQETIQDLEQKGIKPYQPFEVDNFEIDFSIIEKFLGGRVRYSNSRFFSKQGTNDTY